MVLLWNVLPRASVEGLVPRWWCCFWEDVELFGFGALLDEVGLWVLSLKGILTMFLLLFYLRGCHKVNNSAPTHPSTMKLNLIVVQNQQNQLTMVRKPRNHGSQFTFPPLKKSLLSISPRHKISDIITFNKYKWINEFFKNPQMIFFRWPHIGKERSCGSIGQIQSTTSSSK